MASRGRTIEGVSDIVLVHGTTQSATGFARLVDALEPSGHRVVCVDVPSAAATSAAGYAELLATQVPDDMHVSGHRTSRLLVTESRD
jgi:pimeloyl-ACP methyl ester carboxylesterase